jgi:DNA topoisomerase-1
MNTLIIIESPFKVPAIKSFLGKGYKVVASQGHVRDLPKSKLGIDIENDFEPQYINIRGRGELINSLRKEAKNADRILLATDPDREGEAISWHLINALKLDASKAKRITFNEVTKNAFKEALKNPREINMNLVDAQQARRILDRLVGYKISPFLWKKIKNGLSAGRVQSVATRLIVEREEEIKAFQPEEYWTIAAKLLTEKGVFVQAKFIGDEKGKIELENEEQVKKILEAVKDKEFIVREIKKAVKTRRPQPPFTTSTLQQEANKRLGFQSQRTMKIAQELYEGVNLGEKNTHGLITYMRTDSLRISDEAREAAKSFINEKYGEKYYPKEPNIYKSKKSAQDAHEAIRPSDPAITPESVKGKLTPDQYKLYKLIWDRFIASQMSAALIDTVAVDYASGGYVFRSNGETVKFLGYKALYEDLTDDGDEEGEGKNKLPEFTEGEKLKAEAITPEQHFTQPPSRFTEGSLVKILEEKGIGRPSTYAPTISTIISRGYIKREGKALIPTELGFVTTDLMKNSFAHIVDYNFTAQMEEDLDKIEDGIIDYVSVLKEFFSDFSKQLEEAEKNLSDVKIEIPKEETDIICEKCGAKMIVKQGRFGKFAACPNYPACKNTSKLESVPSGENGEEKAKEVIADVKCKNCGADMVLRRSAFGNFFACRNYPDCKTTMPYYKDTGITCPDCGKRILLKQTKNRKTYYSCENYPECSFSVWDIPQERRCPKCGGLVLKKKSKEYYYCRNCDWNEGKE